MIQEKEIIELLKKASKKIPLKNIGVILLIPEIDLKEYIEKEKQIPVHERWIIKKTLEQLLNTKKTSRDK